jgi:hypothetical protein
MRHRKNLVAMATWLTEFVHPCCRYKTVSANQSTYDITAPRLLEQVAHGFHSAPVYTFTFAPELHTNLFMEAG